MADDERREHERYVVWFPVHVEAGEGGGVAVSKNVSAKGILMASAEELEVGAKVQVQFRVLPVDSEPRTIEGRIVRTTDNTEDPHGAWPYKMAVEFEQELPELEELLRAASTGNDST